MHISFFLFLFIFFSGALHAQYQDHKMPMDLGMCADSDQMCACIADSFSDSFFLDQVTFDADIPLSRHEFMHLIGLVEGTHVSSDQVSRACLHLKHKNRFERVCIGVHQTERGLQLHFHLVANWQFAKLVIEGIWIGKDNYRHAYHLEPGECFDHTKHEHACNALRQQLYDQGYCMARVVDKLVYDEPSKSVTVRLYINRGKKFNVRSVNCTFSATDQAATDDEKREVANDVCLLLEKRLVGHTYTQEVVDKEKKAMGRYLETKGYPQAEIEVTPACDNQRKAMVLNFQVNIPKRKHMFVFQGNRFFSQEHLFNNIVHEQAIAALPDSMIEQELVDAYKKKGFWSIVLHSWQQGKERVFSIDEGPRVYVQRIMIKGARQFKSSYLVRQHLAFARTYYDADNIKKGLDALVAFYLRRGFWDVQILKYEYEPLPAKNKYKLVVIIHEGQQRHLASVSVSGHQSLVHKIPHGTISSKKNIPFDLAIMTKQKRWLIGHFYKQGYRTVRVIPELHEKDGAVDLTWAVTLSEQRVTFGKTIINSTGHLPFDLIMRELQYQEGQRWDRKKIEQSLKRLRSLELFDSIYCTPAPIEDDEDVRPIILKLVESDPFEVRTRLGFAKVSKSLTLKDTSTYKIGGSLLWHNPCNVGDQLRLDADFTLFNRAVTGSYRLPWIFNLPIKTVLKAYSSKYFHPTVRNSSKTIYDAVHDGFGLTMRYEYSHGVCGLNFGIDWTRICQTPESVGRLSSVLEFDPMLVDRRVPYVIIEPHIVVDYLDDVANPRSGLLMRMSVKGMIAQEYASSLGKVMFEQSVFIPFGNVVCGVHLHVGHIFNAPYCKIIPTERFYLGGARTLRGYEPNSAPPLRCLSFAPLTNAEQNGVVVKNNKPDQLVPQGGKTMFNANAELRFPIISTFSGAIFHDVGFLRKDHTLRDKRKTTSLLASTGFGFRFNTPVGPLRFDIAWKWKKRHPDDIPYAWFLTFGHAF